MMKKFLFIFLTLMGSGAFGAEESPDSTAEEASSPPAVALSSYQVTFKTGNAPFGENTKLRISRSADTYLFAPAKGDAWSLPIKSMRGAIASKKGIWIYWFDEGGNTLTGYFEMGEGSLLAAEMNQAVQDYFVNRPQNEVEKLKADYEAYKEQAIRESK